MQSLEESEWFHKLTLLLILILGADLRISRTLLWNATMIMKDSLIQLLIWHMKLWQMCCHIQTKHFLMAIFTLEEMKFRKNAMIKNPRSWNGCLKTIFPHTRILKYIIEKRKNLFGGTSHPPKKLFTGQTKKSTFLLKTMMSYSGGELARTLTDLKEKKIKSFFPTMTKHTLILGLETDMGTITACTKIGG